MLVGSRSVWETVVGVGYFLDKRGLSRDCKSYIIGSILNIDFGSVDGSDPSDLTFSLFILVEIEMEMEIRPGRFIYHINVTAKLPGRLGL
jgi:hypothetical protein